MHKSKLAGFIIDCETENLPAAADFWSSALGMKMQLLPGEEGEKYIRLIDPNEELHIEVQKVDHHSRVHLDIETDNIDAEVRRMQALGAKLVGPVGSWCVMQAPTGQKFCIVRKTSPDFGEKANIWN